MTGSVEVTAPPWNGRRIAILMHSLEPGGAQLRVVWLVNRFVELGNEVEFLLITSGQRLAPKLDPRVKLRMLAGGACTPTGVRSWIAAAALSRYLRRFRPDVVMSGVNLTHAMAIRGWRLSGRAAPIALRLCSNAKLWPNDRRFSAIQRRLWGRDENLYGLADRLIAVSASTAEDFRRVPSIGDRSIDVIYNPTATRDLLERPLRERRQDRSDVPLILSAGKFRNAKGLRTLVQAFAKIRRSRPARLVLLGDGAERRHLQKLAEELGIGNDVEFPGWADDVAPWMERADVVVSASEFEGLPGTLIEALALGCPVVATDCPGGTREILDDGALGPLVPVGDVESMAQAIVEMLDHPPPPQVLRAGADRFGEAGKAEAYLRVFAGLREGGEQRRVAAQL